MFKFFKRRKREHEELILEHNREELTMEKCLEEQNEKKLSQSLAEIPFEKKIMDLNRKGYSLRNESWYPIAESIYDRSGAAGCIKAIEIKNYGDAGCCTFNICGDHLQATITIGAHKMKQGRAFTDTLAHELVHAKDNYDIVNKFGINEYRKIIENKVTKMARDILGEYSACRRTAELYESFDSSEDVGRIIQSTHILLEPVLNGQEMAYDWARQGIYHLNYAIATRCAFADVSEQEEKGLALHNYIRKRIVYENYISRIRELLMKNYEVQPLDWNRYNKLGNQIMLELFKVHGAENNIDRLMLKVL